MKRALAPLLCILMLFTLCACDKAPPETVHIDDKDVVLLPDGVPEGNAAPEPSAPQSMILEFPDTADRGSLVSHAFGTGGPRPEGAAVLRYVRCTYLEREDAEARTETLSEEPIVLTAQIAAFRLPELRDETARARIERAVDARTAELAADPPETRGLAELGVETGKTVWERYTLRPSCYVVGRLLVIWWDAEAEVGLRDDTSGAELSKEEKGFNFEPLYFDLRDGRALSVPELFYGDVDYVALLTAEAPELTSIPERPELYVGLNAVTLRVDGPLGAVRELPLSSVMDAMPLLRDDPLDYLADATPMLYVESQYLDPVRQALKAGAVTLNSGRVPAELPYAAAFNAALDGLDAEVAAACAAFGEKATPKLYCTLYTVGPFCTAQWTLYPYTQWNEGSAPPAPDECAFMRVMERGSGRLLPLCELVADGDAAVAYLLEHGLPAAQAETILDTQSAGFTWTCAPAVTFLIGDGTPRTVELPLGMLRLELFE